MSRTRPDEGRGDSAEATAAASARQSGFGLSAGRCERQRRYGEGREGEAPPAIPASRNASRSLLPAKKGAAMIKSSARVKLAA